MPDPKHITTSFLGTGWRFPPSFSAHDASAGLVSDEEDINQSLCLLLSTRPGERLMRPDFGCDLDRLLFEPLDETLRTYAKGLIQTAILFHEPRITVEDIHLTTADANSGVIHIRIEYRIPATNARSNYVFPFYLTEGVPADE